MKVIRLIRTPQEFADRGSKRVFLKQYYDTRDGRGVAIFTDEMRYAMKFHDSAAAFLFWQQESKYKPSRADGKSNRPLTAYTVEIMEAPEVDADITPTV